MVALQQLGGAPKEMAKGGKKLAVGFTGSGPALAALPEGDFLSALGLGAGGWQRREKTHCDKAGAEGGARAPFVVIKTDRWSSEFTFRTSILKLTIDLSQAAVSGREISLAGAQLKLTSGAPADLFSAAKLFIANAPLRLETRSRQETAKAALAPSQSTVPARQTLAITGDAAAGDVLRLALLASAGRIIAAQPAILEARAPEGLRRMRAELRRLRAMERLYRGYVSGSSLRRLALQARMISRALAPARNWDVFLDQILPLARQDNYAKRGFARLEAAAQAQRAQSWAAAMTPIASRDFSLFGLDLLAAAHLQPWRTRALEQSARILAPKMLNKARRRTRKTAKATDFSDPVAMHPLRLALKKQRYAAQLFCGLYPKATRKAYMNAMASLQDRLGGVNDAAMALRLADQAGEGAGKRAMRAAGFVSGYSAAQTQAGAQEITADWAAFEKIAPFWRP